MPDATTEFFERISKPSTPPPMGTATGTVRIDLDRGKATEHYLLAIDKGNISVSTEKAKADAVLHTERELFDRLARGEANALASILRGLISAEGNPSLLVRFQRLFPGPPSARAAQPAPTQEARPA